MDFTNAYIFVLEKNYNHKDIDYIEQKNPLTTQIITTIINRNTKYWRVLLSLTPIDRIINKQKWGFQFLLTSNQI